MKPNFASCTIFLAAMIPMSGALEAAADAQTWAPELVTVPPGNVHAPQGFDDNDNAQLTISGGLLNTCFATGPATAKVDRARKTILIENQEYFHGGSWCIQTRIPYMKIIDLGLLPAGEYRIFVAQTGGIRHRRGTLQVAASPNRGPDDLLYATVEEAAIAPEAAAGRKTLTLKGRLASGCMQLGNVEVRYRAPNVVEVLPVVTVSAGVGCDGRSRVFGTQVEIAPDWSGPTLIHIRSLGGQAVNRITEFKVERR